MASSTTCPRSWTEQTRCESCLPFERMVTPRARHSLSTRPRSPLLLSSAALSSSKVGARGLGIHCSAIQDVRFVVQARNGLTQLLSLDQSGQLITWVVVDGDRGSAAKGAAGKGVGGEGGGSGGGGGGGGGGSGGGDGGGRNGATAILSAEQKSGGEASSASSSSLSTASSARIELVQSACVDFTAYALPPLRVVEPLLGNESFSRLSGAPNDILVACGGGQILRCESSLSSVHWSYLGSVSSCHSPRPPPLSPPFSLSLSLSLSLFHSNSQTYTPLPTTATPTPTPDASQSSATAKTKGLVLDKYSVKPVTGLGWELGMDIPPPPPASGDKDEPFAVTCVSSSQHVPGVFLVGCQNGDVCLFLSNAQS